MGPGYHGIQFGHTPEASMTDIHSEYGATRAASGDSDPAGELLRHTVASLADRAEKALRDAPPEFAVFRVGPSTRSPGEILSHMGDLLDWALRLAEGVHQWRPASPMPWAESCTRFFDALDRFDKYLASSAPLGWTAEQLFQGPIADALTHTGQLAMLRRLAGAPVRGENYAKAEIVAGRVGRQQASERVEFD
jgi:hypothetical protein